MGVILSAFLVVTVTFIAWWMIGFIPTIIICIINYYSGTDITYSHLVDGAGRAFGGPVAFIIGTVNVLQDWSWKNSHIVFMKGKDKD